MEVTEVLSSNASNNSTFASNFQAMYPYTLAYMRSQSLIIVFLNFAVLIILVSNKGKFPAIYWLQIICLAFNDFLAGVANFIISFVDHPYFKDSNINCTVAVVFLFASQSASLYNIFGISIHRFVVLKKSNIYSNVWRHRHTLLSTAIAWTVSLVLCILPVLLFSNATAYKEANYCSVQTLFGANVKSAMIILMGSFILPLLFTNILYIVLFCALRLVWQTVKPIETNTNSEVGSLCSMTALFNGTEVCNLSGNTERIANISNQSHLSEQVFVQSEKLRSLNETEPSTLHDLANTTKAKNAVVGSKSLNASTLKPKIPLQAKQRGLFLEVPKRQDTVQLINVKPLCQPSTSTSIEASASGIGTKSYNGSPVSSTGSIKTLAKQQIHIPHNVLRQRKAYTLLGIILLFLNILTWPGIVALVLTSMINTISLGRETLLPLFTTICVNSAVNPVLYTATITEFRSVLCEILLTIYKVTKRRLC